MPTKVLLTIEDLRDFLREQAETTWAPIKDQSTFRIGYRRGLHDAATLLDELAHCDSIEVSAVKHNHEGDQLT